MSSEHPNSGAVLTIGKDRGCDIVIDSPYISAVHAQLFQKDGRWWVRDSGSKNGTGVNSQKEKVYSPTPVNGSDTIYLGPVALKVADILNRRVQAAAPQAPRQVQGKTYIIGRSRDADIRLNFDYISRRHARLIRTQDKQWFIEDLGSQHGTSVGQKGKRTKGPIPLKETDRIYFGTYGVKATKLVGKLKKRKQGLKADITVKPSARESIIVGRDPKAHIQLDYPQISWHHSRITPLGDKRWVVEDLGSRNGTFVNGKRVSKKTVLHTDTISLGPYELDITVDNQVVARDLTGDIRLDSLNGGVVVRSDGGQKAILNDVNFTVFPSEFVGLMGLSGAGKTTLLMSLLGYRKYSHGQVKINGLDVYEHYDQFKTLIGYVPQDDILHGELGVEEALVFAARLRLPSDMPQEEIRNRVLNVLQQLGLYLPEQNIDVRDLPVRSSFRKSISGGQRKRVSLAMELITEPSILFLDEPTSGLSSVDTISVMKVLRELADQGKTIILTVHQPDIESFRQMDNVIVLDKGEMVYYGPTWPDSLTFFNPAIPEEEVIHRPESGLVGLSKQETRHWKRTYDSSNLRNEYVEGRRDSNRFISEAGEATRGLSRGLFSFRQWFILVQRNLALKFKDRINTMILLIQAPIIGLLLGMIFHGQKNVATPLFMLVVSGLWLGTSNAVREIVSEQSIYLRERMIGLGIPEYMLSKFSVLTGLSCVQCLFLIGISRLFVDFKSPFLSMFWVLLLVTLVGCSLGLLLSALVRSRAAAQALVPLSILPMVLLGGGIIRLPDAEMGMAKYVTQAMPSRWGFEAMVHAESPLWHDENTAVRQAEYLQKIEEAKAKAKQVAHIHFNTVFMGKKSKFSWKKEHYDKAILESVPKPEPVPEEGLMIGHVFGDYRVGLMESTGVLGGFLLIFLLGTGLVQKKKDPM